MIGICIDPFETTPGEIRNVVDSLKNIFGKTPKVKYVFISSRADSSLSLAFDQSPEDRYTKFPTAIIAKTLTKAGIKFKPQDIHVAFEDVLSKASILKRLEKECKKLNVKAVAIYSHRRSKLDKFLLGSFTEVLVSKTSLNIIAIK